FFQAEDGIRDGHVTGVQTCALPISPLGFFWLFPRHSAPASAKQSVGATSTSRKSRAANHFSFSPDRPTNSPHDAESLPHSLRLVIPSITQSPVSFWKVRLLSRDRRITRRENDLNRRRSLPGPFMSRRAIRIALVIVAFGAAAAIAIGDIAHRAAARRLREAILA